MAEYSHLSEPDPEFAPYIAQINSLPPLPQDDWNTRRRRFDSFIVATSNKTYGPQLPKETEYRVIDHQVDVANGKIRVRIIIPTSSVQTYPLMLWIHGGGWTDGNVELDDYQLRAISVEFQISVVNVEYRLAPENPHPTGLNDCYSALKWAAESESMLCADFNKGFIVAGSSAGGTLATILAHRARDDVFFKDRRISGQILQVPGLLHPNAVPDKYKPCLLSFEQNKDAPILSAEGMLWCYSALGGSPTDPEVSPLLYPSHGGLPPTVIQVCGFDPLRDEAFLFDKLLRNEGVKTKTTVYPGVPHAFHYSFPNVKMAVKWEEDFRSGLRWLLEGAPQ
ncbi:Alpha/Beta hydrolase protein [Mycena maculata]|uniref:Alpha/Beta hydrolase protein n=1 Tax=Mycena maculata TaxID=230809 RepID=A0AAD7KAL4_9AGAR|nr:Alpha/Beta hydrolase protein [Mycena maculata]